MRIAVLIPTLGRPERIGPVVDNVVETSDGHDVNVYFVCEAGDVESVLAVAKHPTARLVINVRSASYAGAINSALHKTGEPFLFVGADDLRFHPGWVDPLVSLAESHGVVGTNDLGNPEVAAGEHATHFLVRRDYAVTGCVDEPGVMLHEGYSHNWCDREFVGTAKHRGQFAPCLESLVEHVHWAWGKASLDPTYDKGRAGEPADRGTYTARQHMWGGL
jgi:hypothetical protein